MYWWRHRKGLKRQIFLARCIARAQIFSAHWSTKRSVEKSAFGSEGLCFWQAEIGHAIVNLNVFLHTESCITAKFSRCHMNAISIYVRMCLYVGIVQFAKNLKHLEKIFRLFVNPYSAAMSFFHCFHNFLHFALLQNFFRHLMKCTNCETALAFLSCTIATISFCVVFSRGVLCNP